MYFFIARLEAHLLFPHLLETKLNTDQFSNASRLCVNVMSNYSAVVFL